MVNILTWIMERQLEEPAVTKEGMEEWLVSHEVKGRVEEMCEKVRREKGGGGVKRKGGA